MRVILKNVELFRDVNIFKKLDFTTNVCIKSNNRNIKYPQ